MKMRSGKGVVMPIAHASALLNRWGRRKNGE